MRAPFFILVEDYQSLDEFHAPIFPRTYETYTFSGETFLLHHLNLTVTVEETEYDVVFLLPESLLWQQHLHIFRELRLDERIYEVWVETDLLDKYEDLTDYLLDDNGDPVVPHMIMGDPPPQKLALITYNPSEQDCIDDVEPSYDDVFGVFIEEE